MSVIVSVIGLMVAVVAAAAGLSSLGLGETDVFSANTAANLGVTSILCSLIAIPIGVVGWRWGERRRQPSVLGQGAVLIGGVTFAAWFALFVYALSKDTP